MNHVYPKTLVGNRIVPLCVFEDDQCRINVKSDVCPSSFYFCPELAKKKHLMVALDVALLQAGPDTIGIRIVNPETNPKLQIGLDNSFEFDLEHPGVSEWKSHIDSTFVSLRNNLNQVQRERDNLRSQLDEISKENEQISQQLEWKTKENDLLRMFIEKSESGSGQSHCEPCNCGKNDEDMPTAETSETSMISPVRKREEVSFKTSPASLMPEPRPASPPPESPSDANPSVNLEKSKSDELLWGVAQYIFCQLCPEQASDFKGMENHFINAHLDKEKRNCSACPSETLHDLAGHVQQHTSRVYACEFCGKRGRKHFLKSHIRTHTGERPFNCETCGRGFADASTLRRHRLVHSGVKAHNCPICGIGIARKDNVKVHIKSHGREASTAPNNT